MIRNFELVGRVNLDQLELMKDKMTDTSSSEEEEERVEDQTVEEADEEEEEAEEELMEEEDEEEKLLEFRQEETSSQTEVTGNSLHVHQILCNKRCETRDFIISLLHNIFIKIAGIALRHLSKNKSSFSMLKYLFLLYYDFFILRQDTTGDITILSPIDQSEYIKTIYIYSLNSKCSFALISKK